MGIALRRKANQDGTTSQYLDIYHQGRRWYEFLSQTKLVTKPSSAIDRATNRDNLKLAKRILAKRQNELESRDYNVTPAFKKNTDFLEFFEVYAKKYPKKDKRVILACYSAFKKFLKDDKDIKTLPATHLTPDMVEDFKDHLVNKYHFSTPHNYFKKFKKVIKVAVRKQILSTDPSQDIYLGIAKGINKSILSYKEYELLAKTKITNHQVKKAFFFSLYTGLRFSDIVALKWKNIDLVNQSLNLRQAKTGREVNMLLNDVAINVIGKKGKPGEPVFNLPSHTACSKALGVWTKKAGISKYITWHCARHSFATNHIIGGIDTKTISELLGHTSTAYTERYTHLVKEIKDKAILNIPKVKLEGI